MHDTNAINVILATDCGSTTTKAILIEKVDGPIARRIAARRRPPSKSRSPM